MLRVKTAWSGESPSHNLKSGFHLRSKHKDKQQTQIQ